MPIEGDPTLRFPQVSMRIPWLGHGVRENRVTDPRRARGPAPTQFRLAGNQTRRLTRAGPPDMHVRPVAEVPSRDHETRGLRFPWRRVAPTATHHAFPRYLRQFRPLAWLCACFLAISLLTRIALLV